MDDIDGIFAVDAPVTINGIVISAGEIAFFDASQGGGFDVCLHEGCSPDPPLYLDRWAVLGDTLFSGSVFAPVFVSGPVFVDQTQSFIEAPAPEPASVSLAMAGLDIAMVAVVRRRVS